MYLNEILFIMCCLLSVFIITIPPLFFGLYYMANKAVGGEKVEIGDIFKGMDYLVQSYILFLISAIAIGVGLILLIVPGVALILLLQYSIPVAISKKVTAIESMKKSITLARDNLVFSIVFFILLGIINSIASSVFVGLLITMPFTAIMTLVAVKKIG